MKIKSMHRQKLFFTNYQTIITIVGTSSHSLKSISVTPVFTASYILYEHTERPSPYTNTTRLKPDTLPHAHILAQAYDTERPSCNPSSITKGNQV